MRITIVTGPFTPVPPGPAGAVEKIWSKLALEFCGLGQKVTLVSRAYNGLPKNDIQDGLLILRRSGFSRTGRRVIDLALDLLYALSVLPWLPKAEIVVTNTFFLPILTSCLLRAAGKTVVSVERYPKGQLRFYKRCARLRAPSRAVQDAGVTQTPTIRQLLKVIPNPVDVDTFYPPLKRRPSPQEGSILFTGRIHPEKGLHLLVKAFRIVYQEFPNTTLLLVGPDDKRAGGGGRKYIDDLRLLATGLPVIFKPPIYEPTELADLLRRMSIFCYPSIADKGESFGVAPLEAMATGLPVVVSKLEVFSEFIDESETGLIFDHKSSSPERELASKLRILLSDETLWAKIGSQGASKALQFSYQSVAKAFLNDFVHLTKER